MLTESCESGTITTPILQLGKLSLTEIWATAKVSKWSENKALFI